MSGEAFVELVRGYSARWIITAERTGAIRVTHKQAWPPVTIEEADAEPLIARLKAWEAEQGPVRLAEQEAIREP